MFSLFTFLFFSPSAEANPKLPTERFPKQFVNLLEKGGWTPTPTNSGRYQIGDVFDFSKNEKILGGQECFAELPDPAPMADMNIINMLKGGLTVPFGIFKGKVRGKRYKKSTFANTEVRELSKMALETGMNSKCQSYLRKISTAKKDNYQLIKAIIQSVVQEQECTGKEVGFGFQKAQIGAGNYEQCAQESQVQVTIAYQLIPLSTILSGAATTTGAPLTSGKRNEVSVSGGDQDFAALARQIKEQEAAEKAKSERLRQAKIALGKAVQKKLEEAELKLQVKATRDWNAIKGMLNGGSQSVRGLVKKYIQSYDNVKLEIEGFSKTAKIPEVALAKKWLANQVDKPSASASDDLSSSKDKITDFFHFLGVSAGSKLEDFTKIHGKPNRFEDTKKHPFVSYYFQLQGRKVTVRVSRKTDEISHMTIYWSRAEQKSSTSRKSTDFSSAFAILGMHIKSIKKKFGKPERSHADNHGYKIEKSSHTGVVTFIAYKFDEKRCSSIYVHWHRKTNSRTRGTYGNE